MVQPALRACEFFGVNRLKSFRDRLKPRLIKVEIHRNSGVRLDDIQQPIRVEASHGLCEAQCGALIRERYQRCCVSERNPIHSAHLSYYPQSPSAVVSC
jgi:hypothetical protein